MRAIKYTNLFKRDYRREKSGVLGKKLDTLLREAIDILIEDMPLPLAMWTIHWLVNGKITATATFGPI
jgi:mRNA-degrading endonuclease YafQ of YafQ-DinJ toxin-antitoxin module